LIAYPQPRGEQAQHGRLTERRVHAEFQGQAPAQAGAEAVDHGAEEGRRLLGVVDGARLVLAPQDMACLGQMREQGMASAAGETITDAGIEGPRTTA
jgi:hypothetical protein